MLFRSLIGSISSPATRMAFEFGTAKFRKHQIYDQKIIRRFQSHFEPGAAISSVVYREPFRFEPEGHKSLFLRQGVAGPPEAVTPSSNPYSYRRGTHDFYSFLGAESRAPSLRGERNLNDWTKHPIQQWFSVKILHSFDYCAPDSGPKGHGLSKLLVSVL